jgi:hypothetical protein
MIYKANDKLFNALVKDGTLNITKEQVNKIRKG